MEACDQLLHGDSANRWFDKAMSLIVFADGSAGINDEHCLLDGSTVISFIDDLLASSTEEHSLRSGAQPQGLPVRRSDRVRARQRPAGRHLGRRRPRSRPTRPVSRRRQWSIRGLRRAIGPSSCGYRRMVSSRWPTNWPTSAPRASSAPPTNPSLPATTITASTEAMRGGDPRSGAVRGCDGRSQLPIPAERLRRLSDSRRKARAAREGMPSGTGARAASLGAAAHLRNGSARPSA